MTESFEFLSHWLEKNREAHAHPFHAMAGLLRNLWLETRTLPPMAPERYVDYFNTRSIVGDLPFLQVPLPTLSTGLPIEAFVQEYDLAHLIRMIRHHLYGLINHVIETRSTCTLLDYGAGAGCGLYGKEREAILREYDLSILEHVSDPGRVDFRAIDKFMTPGNAVFETSHYQKEDILTFRPPGRFDLITGHHVLEHCLDWRAMLAKAHELLRPGGFFYLSFPAFCCFSDALYRLLTKTDHVATYTRGEILDHADGLGFETLFSTPYVDPANRWSWLTRLESDRIDNELQSRCYDLAVQAGVRSHIFFHHFGWYILLKKAS